MKYTTAITEIVLALLLALTLWQYIMLAGCVWGWR